jgi:hypothetical protein
MVSILPPDRAAREISPDARVEWALRQRVFQKLQRLEDGVSSPIAPWSLKPVSEPSVRQCLQSVHRQRRARGISAQPFEPETVRKSLERRVRKKAPLFAERIIADEIAANPKYFNPVEE